MFDLYFYKKDGNLKDKIDKKEPIDHETIFNWSKEIINGLNYLHTKKIIHRDLVPR